MGIPGLHPVMKPAMQEGKAGDLGGGEDGVTTLTAVDASGWIVKGYYKCRNAVETYILRQVQLLKYQGVEPVLIFDGKAVDAKKEVAEYRRAQILRGDKKGMKFQVDGDEPFMEVDVLPPSNRQELTESVKQMCIRFGIKYVHAPCEADHQMVKLYREGTVHSLVTEDSDMMVHGTSMVLYKWSNGTGQIYDKTRFNRVWKEPFNIECFRAVCIAIGCDYLKGGIPGVGPDTAGKLYKKHCKDFNLEKFLDDAIKIKDGDKNPAETRKKIMEKFHIAWNTFLFQLIYDKETGSIGPLTPYPEGKSAADFPYAGNPLDVQGSHFWPTENTIVPKPLPSGKAWLKLHYCKQCTEIFPTRVALRMHVIKEHPIQCNVCAKTFICRAYLVDHEKVHETHPQYSCDHCGKRIWTLQRLWKHMYDIHRGVLFRCDICSRPFTRRETLVDHQLVHTEERPISCDICGRGFKSNRHLAQHSRVHSENLPFECDICGRGFKHKRVMEEHKGTHNPGKPHKCARCGIGYRRRQDLKLHMQKCKVSLFDAQARDPRCPYMCNLCKKDFRTKDELKVHRRRKHANHKPFSCDLCKKAFKTRQGRIYHRSLHTDQGKYKCHHCNKISPTLSAYKIHMASCKFKQLADLVPDPKKKLELFNNTRPYQRGNAGIVKNGSIFTEENKRKHFCEICQVGFPYLSLLKKHQSQQGHLKRLEEKGLETEEIVATSSVASASTQPVAVAAAHGEKKRKLPDNDEQPPQKMQKILEPIDLTCQVCERSFSTLVKLNQHVKLAKIHKLNMKKKGIVLDTTTRVFVRIGPPLEQKDGTASTSTSPNEGNLFSCGACGQVFMTEGHHLNHYEVEHADLVDYDPDWTVTIEGNRHEKTYSCNYCENFVVKKRGAAVRHSIRWQHDLNKKIKLGIQEEDEEVNEEEKAEQQN